MLYSSVDMLPINAFSVIYIKYEDAIAAILIQTLKKMYNQP